MIDLDTANTTNKVPVAADQLCDQARSTDSAAAWAAAFMATVGTVPKSSNGIEIDFDLMLGWFANAIVVGQDVAARRQEV